LKWPVISQLVNTLNIGFVKKWWADFEPKKYNQTQAENPIA